MPDRRLTDEQLKVLAEWTGDPMGHPAANEGGQRG